MLTIEWLGRARRWVIRRNRTCIGDRKPQRYVHTQFPVDDLGDELSIKYTEHNVNHHTSVPCYKSPSLTQVHMCGESIFNIGHANGTLVQILYVYIIGVPTVHNSNVPSEKLPILYVGCLPRVGCVLVLQVHLVPEP